MHGGPKAAQISSMPYKMIVFLGDLGVCRYEVVATCYIGASCVAECVPLILFVVACSQSYLMFSMCYNA